MSVNTRTTLDKVIGNKGDLAKTISPRQRFYISLTFLISGILMTGILLFQMPSGMETGEYLVGEPSPRTIFAPFELSYTNEKLTQAVREKKAAEVMPVYDYDAAGAASVREKTEAFFTVFQEYRDDISPEKTLTGKLPFEISENGMRRLAETGRFQELREFLKEYLEKNLQSGVLGADEKQKIIQNGVTEVSLVDDTAKTEKMAAVYAIPTPEDVRAIPNFPDALKKERDAHAVLQEVLTAVTLPVLKPNEAETQARRAKAAAAADPVIEKIKKDQLVVQRGMLVTPEGRERMLQIQKKTVAKKILNQLLVLAYLVILVYSLCFAYLYYFEKRNLFSLKKVIFFHTVLLLTVLISKSVTLLPDGPPYLMPFAVGALLLAILETPRAAVLCAVMTASLIAPIVDFSPEIILMALLSSLMGIFGSLRLRKRIHFLRAGALIGIASFAVIFIYRIYHEYPIKDSLQVAGLGLANGLLITVPICFLLVPILEWIFDLTSEITLLELSDLNHPLLKRMIVEAPGTYHHSLVVSTLAESACEAIGANALLARVGCYFHDIGKIPRAEFFTENYQGTAKGNSKHDKLTPSMSCLVILNHVKDGIELGRQYKLKDPILRFIPEHQGKGVIYYFYRKALDRAQPGEKVNPDDYRYPGPKPQSKETAVALLADSTEAASRSLKDPSPESIRTLVRKIINDKFVDGQMDECDLTLKDLHKIQESFIHNLMAIFHTRVTYPAPLADDCDNPDLFGEDQFEKFRTEKPEKESRPGKPGDT